MSTPTTPAEGRTLLAGIVRKRSPNHPNATKNAVIFMVRVLTKPLPYNSNSAKMIIGDGYYPSAGNPNDEDRPYKDQEDQVPRIMFRGRIISSNNGLRPHIFLKDPCRITSAVKVDKLNRLIHDHTMFISKQSYSGIVPKLGDVVQVVLQKSDFDGPELKVAHFDEIMDTSDGEFYDASEHGAGCSSLKYMIETGGESSYTNLATTAGSGDPWSAKRDMTELVKEIRASDDLSTEVIRTPAGAGLDPTKLLNRVIQTANKFNVTASASSTTSALIGTRGQGVHETKEPAFSNVVEMWASNTDLAKGKRQSWGESQAKNRIAWSAAYINYIIRPQDPTFQAGTWYYGHTNYTKVGWKARSTSQYQDCKWYPYSLIDETVEPAVGDIFIFEGRYKGSKDHASHGDICYKIVKSGTKTTYMLAGGNMRNTNIIDAYVFGGDDGLLGKDAKIKPYTAPSTARGKKADYGYEGHTGNPKYKLILKKMKK
tara:strand:+ start:6681 stop:8132 length:1452 start_codon:yes stop_codon:yes gene_type:complete